MRRVIKAAAAALGLVAFYIALATAQVVPHPDFGSVNVTTATAYKQNGSTIVTQTNGVASPDVCSVNCDLLVGTNAGSSLGTADYLSTFVGWGAAANMTSGTGGNPGASESTCVGYKCLYAVTTGTQNTAVGINALGTTANGAAANSHDVLMGTDVMRQAYPSANYDIGLGVSTLINSGDSSTIAIGDTTWVGKSTVATTGHDNIILGRAVCPGNFSGGVGGSQTSASQNVVIGNFALTNCTSFSNSVVIGHSAGAAEVSAAGEVLIGQKAGLALNGSGSNVVIGNGAAITSTALNQSIVIGPLAGSVTNHLGAHNVIIGTGSSVDTVNLANAVDIENVITGTGPSGTNPSMCVVGMVCRLGHITAADFNSVADQAIVIGPMTSSVAGYLSSATKYFITEIDVGNCSASLTTAKGALYTAASKAGTIIGATTTPFTACTSTTTRQRLTALTNEDTTILTAATLYLSLTTAQGGAATGDVDVYGIPYN